MSISNESGLFTEEEAKKLIGDRFNADFISKVKEGSKNRPILLVWYFVEGREKSVFMVGYIESAIPSKSFHVVKSVHDVDSFKYKHPAIKIA